jgi:aspartate/tyrosine/aromatic aminotransferase
MSMLSKRYVSCLSSIKLAPTDPILGLTTAYLNDPKPHSYKINLGVGAYRDENGKPWVLESVKEAEKRIAKHPDFNHEYIPIMGTNEFVNLVQNFLFNHNSMPNSQKLLNDKRIITGQGISGTGSLRVLGEFINKEFPGTSISIPNPSWANHNSIFQNSNINVKKYSYYDPLTQGLNLSKMLEDLYNLPKFDSVLLHVCCHNPTGIDPNLNQWDEILKVIEDRQLLPLFDMAYQGFSNGIEEDLKVVEKVCKLINSNNSNLDNALFAQSFAKNMGLYGERVGSFSIIGENQDEMLNVASQLKIAVRSMYSSPPAYGSKIVVEILNDPELYNKWCNEVSIMRNRLKDMRKLLFNKLKDLGCKGPNKSGETGWEHIIEQNGMFCFTGLTPDQVNALQKQSIYLTKNGRISIAGINESNVERLATAIAGVFAS